MVDELLQAVNACRCPCTQNTKHYIHTTHVHVFFFILVTFALLSVSAGGVFFVYFPGALGINDSVGTSSGAIVTEYPLAL